MPLQRASCSVYAFQNYSCFQVESRIAPLFGVVVTFVCFTLIIQKDTERDSGAHSSVYSGSLYLIQLKKTADLFPDRTSCICICMFFFLSYSLKNYRLKNLKKKNDQSTEHLFNLHFPVGPCID